MTFKSALATLAVLFMLQPAFAETGLPASASPSSASPSSGAPSGEIPAEPADLATEDVAAIRNMIIGQFDAFRKDDAEKAFSFAAPNIRKIFRTPEVFLHMVRKSYKSVYRPQSYKFRTIRNIDGKIVQPVTVVGPSGITETALYIMELQPDGIWRIGACIMAQEPGHET